MTIGTIREAQNNPVDVLAVGALDGHLLVFERLATGAIGTLLYSTQVEGSVGNHNSIVIADLDPNAPGEELYAAGSLGLRKWRH